MVCDSSAVAGSTGEEGRGPRAVLHRAKVTTNVGQRLRHLVLRQVLDQAQQLFSLRAHGTILDAKVYGVYKVYRMYEVY